MILVGKQAILHSKSHWYLATVFWAHKNSFYLKVFAETAKRKQRKIHTHLFFHMKKEKSTKEYRRMIHLSFS